MTATLATAAGKALAAAVPGIPGVVAMATDRAGNFYEGAAGVRRLGDPAPMTLDTVFCIFSCTKAVTAVALLQLLEDGKIALDDPAVKYVPGIARLQVLTGFDAAGQPQTRAPAREITLRHLLLHTSGLGYDFTHPDILRAHKALGIPGNGTGRRIALDSVLLFDPGEDWHYGLSLEWAGLVVEAVAGASLGDAMQERIFAPLGMADTGYKLAPPMRARLAALHQRGAGGMLKATDFETPQDPEVQMGGSALYSTVPDYMRFIRMILNDGAGAHGRVLKPATVALAARNGLLAGMTARMPRSAMPARSNDFDFFPGIPKTWGMSFMINEVDLPTGRPAGSLSWAGLGNLYYWIDRRNGIGGMWAGQVLPFVDVVAAPAAVAFETAVYRHLPSRRLA